MPKQKNIATVTALKDKVARARAVYLTDYRGLTHKQLENLHRLVKKVQGEFVVVKNSLLKISLSSAHSLVPSALTGPTAALFSYGDEITPLKELAKFMKSFSLPKIKLGLVGTNVYAEDEVIRLSKLPSKAELQAQVVSRLNGPIYGIAYVLNANIQKLVYMLGQIRK